MVSSCLEGDALNEYWNRLTEAWPHDWPAKTLVCAHVGSIAHGTHLPSDDPESIDDVDVMWIFQPPRPFVYGLQRCEHWTPAAGTYAELDIIGYSVQKLTALLLKSNPNVMGLFWLPASVIFQAHPLWEDWVANRHAFLSRRIFDAFIGYAVGQLRRAGHPNHMGRLGKERREQFARYGYSPKNAAHCLRLLRMGLELAETGELHVDRTDIDADEIKAVKRGEWTLGMIEREADKGLARMRVVERFSKLPAHPDTGTIERLLMQTVEALW